MANNKEYIVPNPILDKREEKILAELTERYNKLIEPRRIEKIGKKIGTTVPDKIKETGKDLAEEIKEKEFYMQAMRVIEEGFHVLEKHAAKLTINEGAIVKKVNEKVPENEICCLDEICFARGYDVIKLANKYKTQDLALAVVEGGTTGALGFPGLPFNLALSVFLFYRAVQSIAMVYGYDPKNDSAEMVIASEVLIHALNPRSKGIDEMESIIGKILIMSEAAAIKQTVRKSWADMAAAGGIRLLLTQMRALAHRSAQKALENVGKRGLEESIFRGVFAQIGRKLSQKTIARAVPVAGAIVGALFDTAQMDKIFEYADMFYSKRFLLEKEVRIYTLIEPNNDEIVIDVPFDEV